MLTQQGLHGTEYCTGVMYLADCVLIGPFCSTRRLDGIMAYVVGVDSSNMCEPCGSVGSSEVIVVLLKPGYTAYRQQSIPKAVPHLRVRLGQPLCWVQRGCPWQFVPRMTGRPFRLSFQVISGAVGGVRTPNRAENGELRLSSGLELLRLREDSPRRQAFRSPREAKSESAAWITRRILSVQCTEYITFRV